MFTIFYLIAAIVAAANGGWHSAIAAAAVSLSIHTITQCPPIIIEASAAVDYALALLGHNQLQHWPRADSVIMVIIVIIPGQIPN